MPAEVLVHIVDDDEAVRDALCELCEAAGFPARSYESATIFLEVLPKIQGGCVVTDVRMPVMSGLDLLRQMRRQGDEMPVIVLTGEADVSMAVDALRAGAADFIEKPVDEEVMLAAVKLALRRGVERTAKSEQRAQYAQRIASLSVRQREVLDGLVAGQSNKTIARDLAISPRTVEVYRANIMSKLQAGSLSDVVRMAVQAADG
ncbi:MAG: fixJ [Phenylobacterium sp.]|nr:fixJ [Phenylobacterium sp.]MDB5493085.1 fixJ [Phenylobacterium sp.]